MNNSEAVTNESKELKTVYNELHGMVSCVFDNVNTLTEKLVPVLGPDLPQDLGEDQGEPNSELAKSIHHQVIKLHGANKQILNLISRQQVS